MTFKQHAYPLRLEPTASRYLIAISVCMHIAAIVSLFIASLPWYINCFGLIVWTLSFTCSLRRYRRCLALIWNTQGKWLVSINHHAYKPARLLGSSVVNQYCVWLHLSCEQQGIIGVILTPDTLPRDMFRRLRVRLLIEGTREKTL